MLKYICKRLLQAIPVLWVIITITYLMVRMAPGDPFTDEKQTSPQARASLEAYYGLNDPLPTQYYRYLVNVLKGDLGPSYKNTAYTVNELIGQSFPVSLTLGLISFAIALILGVAAGAFAALRRNTFLDHATMSVTMMGICLPTFVLGPLLVLVFAHWLRWFNPSGWYDPSDWILPSLPLGLYYAAYIARLTRASMLEVLSQNFIQTARAKGLSEWVVTVKHALRLSLLPIVSFAGPAFAGIISGSFVIETIFNIPGLGKFFVEAAFNRDYTLVQGTVLFYGTLIVVFNLFVDVIQAMLNPKIRYS